MRIFIYFLLLFCNFLAEAQTPFVPVDPPMALDLQEAMQRISVVVKDLQGREETRQIPITIFRPKGNGPFPLVIMNHGRADAENRALQGRQHFENLSRYLVNKGFVVLLPTRVGYGETYGDFDPEAAGSCSARRMEPMSLAASDQVIATLEFAKTLPYVDVTHWAVMGESVGGLTAVATVWRNPPGLVGGINFSGGSGGNPVTNPGSPCSPQALERLWKNEAASAKVPMLWLYWMNDKCWGEEVPKKWYSAWTAGGGVAEFHSLPAVGRDGHSGFVIDMDTWVPLVEKFLAEIGFGKPGLIVKPPASGFARVDEADKVPTSKANQDGLYRKFLSSKTPRAVALDKEGFIIGYATGDWAMGRALGFCQSRRGDTCKLYAVDDDVVWNKE